MALAMLPIAGSDRPPQTLPLPSLHQLQGGDLIFRRGEGFWGTAINHHLGRQDFTHGGIIDRQGEKVWVIHAALGDPPGQGTVIRETVAQFLQREPVTGWGIYRWDHLTTGDRQTLLTYLRQQVAHQTPFDSQFDLSTGDRLYCTELIWRGFRPLGIDLSQGRRTQIALPFAQDRYLLPQDLLKNPHLQRVAETAPPFPP